MGHVWGRASASGSVSTNIYTCTSAIVVGVADDGREKGRPACHPFLVGNWNRFWMQKTRAGLWGWKVWMRRLRAYFDLLLKEVTSSLLPSQVGLQNLVMRPYTCKKTKQHTKMYYVGNSRKNFLQFAIGGDSKVDFVLLRWKIVFISHFVFISHWIFLECLFMSLLKTLLWRIAVENTSWMTKQRLQGLLCTAESVLVTNSK